MRVGRPEAINIGIRKSRGEFIAILDADDIAMPDRLMKQVSYLRKHPEIGMLGTWSYKLSEEKNIIGKLTAPEGDYELRRWLKHAKMAFTHTSMMFKRNLMFKVDLYDRFQRTQDFIICR